MKVLPNGKVEVKVMVKTPKGAAENIEKKWGFMLRSLILGKKPLQTKVSASGDKIIWRVETDLKKAVKISKRLGMYEALVTGVFSSKLMQKGIAKYFSKEQQAEVKDLLLNHTKIKLIN